MQKLFRHLSNTLQSGENAVLVTIIASSGSTPRGAGARMLVTNAGRVYGTIGGGAVEHRAEQTAYTVLQTKSACTAVFHLHENAVQDLGMVCGGSVAVYFSYIPAGDPAVLALAEQAGTLYRSGEEAWLIYDITAGAENCFALYSKKSGLFGIDVPLGVLGGLPSRTEQVSFRGRTYYCEQCLRAGRVFLFGGGHVSQALVPALTAVDFRCVVLEDRAEFCKNELFPGVEETRLIDVTRVADYATIGADDYIAIMTRGHKDDLAIMAQALKTPACYIGVIGSARKSAAVFTQLRAQGFTDAELARITTPIGLAILAETPAEIAVSITAQLIQVRAARGKAEN